MRHIEADFLGMAKLGDLLEVNTILLKKKRASLILKQTITHEKKRIYEMDITLVFVREGKPSMIPEDLMKLISKSE